MNLLKLSITGFRSFRDAQQIDFSIMKPGLYHVTGENLQEPELEANGAGKSSIFEAVYWCRFGKTSRGVKAGDVKNWEGKSKCEVETEWHDEQKQGPAFLTRTQSPNTLYLNAGGGDGESHPTTQEELDRLFGDNETTFLYANYFAQFSPAFIDLRPEEQMGIYTGIMDLDIWGRASERAGDATKDLERRITSKGMEIAGLQGQADELLKQDFEEEEKNWEAGKAEVIAGINKQIKSGVANKLDKEELIEHLAGELPKFTKLEEQLAGLSKEYTRIHTDLAVAEAEYQTLKRTKTTCQTCGQKLPVGSLKEKTAGAKEKVDAIAKTLSQIIDAIKLVQDDLKPLEEFKAQLERERYALQEQLRTLKRLRIDLAEEQSFVNTFIAKQQALELRGAKLAEDLLKAEEQKATLNQELEQNKFWIKGFKDVRLSLVEESLAQLSVESNQVLFQLGLQDWELCFEAEKENKSGTISNKFSITVKSPHTDSPVPWRAWSGGEGQRLRLASSMGLSNLIAARTGAKSNFEFWDEPSTWLSEAGITDLLDVLKERAEMQGKIILLADHRSLEYGGFAGIINVVKDKKHGSRIKT